MWALMGLYGMAGGQVCRGRGPATHAAQSLITAYLPARHFVQVHGQQHTWHAAAVTQTGVQEAVATTPFLPTTEPHPRSCTTRGQMLCSPPPPLVQTTPPQDALNVAARACAAAQLALCPPSTLFVFFRKSSASLLLQQRCLFCSFIPFGSLPAPQTCKNTAVRTPPCSARLHFGAAGLGRLNFED